VDKVKAHNIKMAKVLCDRNGCNDKLRQIHFDQLVHRAWNPHPSPEFIQWWKTHPDFRHHDVNVVTARNCKSYCDEYKEAVQVGLAELPVDYPLSEQQYATK